MAYINKIRQQQLINRMTNWQRNQWNKAGCPTKKEDLEKFLNMNKTSKALDELQNLGQAYDLG